MIKNIRIILATLFLFSVQTTTTVAQFHTPVLTGVEGQTLLDELVTQYKPINIFGYGPARDTLFSKVYMENDSLSCVYSDHTVYLNPNEDPTTTVFQNGANTGINTEHTYPQGLGAGSGNARSDMHHLYPTKIPVNAARGNLPFGEVPDEQAMAWYYLNQSQSTIPTQGIDNYSEVGMGVFEPKEDHKGNVARAMFYFYTMYKAEADAQDSDYFEEQRATLCDWHLLDTVDQKEWERNAIIASYQEGKENPFILDCTLAARSYCAEFDQSCMSTVSTEAPKEKKGFTLFQNYPNPVYTGTMIKYQLDKPFDVQLRLFDTKGISCKIIVDEYQLPGQYTVNLTDQDLVNGLLYIYQLEVFDGSNYHVISRKLITL